MGHISQVKHKSDLTKKADVCGKTELAERNEPLVIHEVTEGSNSVTVTAKTKQ